MEFNPLFVEDALEAFEYWKEKTRPSVDPKDMAFFDQFGFETWLMSILKKPVYDLLGEKRCRVQVEIPSQPVG